MNKNRLILSVVLIVLFAVTLACGSASPTVQPATISTATSSSPNSTQAPANNAPTAPVNTSTVAPIDTATTAPVVVQTYLGDAVQKDGYAITALSVADPAKPGMLYSAETGKKLVAVEVNISNLSGAQISINPLDTTLVDSDGFSNQADLGSVDDQIATADLNPGEQIHGWISFKISQNATVTTLKYSPEVLSSEFIQVNLLPPPTSHVAITAPITPAVQTSKLGDVIQQNGYSLTADKVEDPSTPGMLYTATQGYKLVAVEIILDNVSGAQALSANPLYAFAIDTNGFVYSTELGGRDGQINSMDLNVGDKVKGWVSFSIPATASLAYIKYQTDMFSGNYLVAGLTK